MEVPPEINSPSTVALDVLAAAPTEILVIVLREIFAPFPPDITIPLTVGAVVMMPVKFIAENVVLVTEWAPDPATEIPVIAVGAVADDVNDSVLFEISAVVWLAFVTIPVTVAPAELIVTELVLRVPVPPKPVTIPITVPVLVPLTEIVFADTVRVPAVRPPNLLITVALDVPARLVKVMLLLEILSVGSLGETEVWV